MVAGLVTAIDIGDTFMEGHYLVATAKFAVASIEYAISSNPFGACLVLCFELMDTKFHFTDNLYQTLDPSYNP